MTIKMILIRVDDMPVDLGEPSQWLRAIKRGQLHRGTMAEVERVGVGAMERVRAEDVPELKLLFDALDPRPEPPPPPMAPEPAAPTVVPEAAPVADAQAEPVPVDEPAPEPAPEAQPWHWYHDQPYVPQHPGAIGGYPPVPLPPRQPAPWKPVLIGFGALLVVGAVVSGANRRDTYARNTFTTAPYTSTTTTSMADPYAVNSADYAETDAPPEMMSNGAADAVTTNEVFDDTMPMSGNMAEPSAPADTGTTTTNTAAPPAEYARNFYLINGCTETAKIWAEYRDPASGQSVRRYFASVDPGESADMRTDTKDFSFSALTASFHWGTSEGGGFERMSRWVANINARDQYFFTLTC